MRTEKDLVTAAWALGARHVKGVPRRRVHDGACPGESEGKESASLQERAALVEAIHRGEDPLGDAFCRLRAPAERRALGAVYTPASLVEAMLGWASALLPAPGRVVDAGCGSARFLVAAGRAFPRAQLFGVELDPLAALLGRGHLAAAGLSARAELRTGDFLALRSLPGDGPTLFVGNPPYVRHHDISRPRKQWLLAHARARGLPVSALAGLHVHFLLQIAERARAGDVGVLVTAAEWLDTRYGGLMRALLSGPLGLEALHVLDAGAKPFADATTTAAVICFRVGARPVTVRVRRADSLATLTRRGTACEVPRATLVSSSRWSEVLAPGGRKSRPSGWVELGELCRVHRGQATGANAVWVLPTDRDAPELPEAVLFPAVTRARELFEAGARLASTTALKRVVDLPERLTFTGESRRQVERFLAEARRRGAHQGFLARHRRAWWSVGLRDAAPVLATYMARRPPAFVLNPEGARHLNIAHGLYPRVTLSDRALACLAAFLSRSVAVGQGRTYAGGLIKFEPGEMERLWLPPLEQLLAGVGLDDV